MTPEAFKNTFKVGDAICVKHWQDKTPRIITAIGNKCFLAYCKSNIDEEEMLLYIHLDTDWIKVEPEKPQFSRTHLNQLNSYLNPQEEKLPSQEIRLLLQSFIDLPTLGDSKYEAILKYLDKKYLEGKNEN